MAIRGMERSEKPIWKNPRFQDCLFIAICVVVCALPQVRGLGFYSDDWQFLGLMTTSAQHSFIGLFRALANTSALMRPVQIACLVVLYRLFGLHPLGYHLVIVGVLLLNGILLYLVIIQLTGQRLLALSVALVYSLLPNYSTDRIWISTFQVTVSTALYLASLLLSLKALEVKNSWIWILGGTALFCVLGSVLAYELVLPLYPLSLLLLWYKDRRLKKPLSRPWPSLNFRILLAFTVAGVSLGGLYKAMTTIRYHGHGNVDWLLGMAKDIIKTHFLFYGAELPYIDWSVARRYSNTTIWILGLGLGVATFWYLHRVVVNSGYTVPRLMGSMGLIGFGLLVAALGYAIFWLAPWQVGFTITGVNNRTAEVASIGVAISFVGGACLFSLFGISDKIRVGIFCLVVSFVVASGFLINNYIASFWTSASLKQGAVLRSIRQQFPVWHAGNVLLLDGVCPYVGPGIVFETYWDVDGALDTVYHAPNIEGDVVSTKAKLGKKDLFTSMYGIARPYPYGKNLIVFNVRRDMVRRLTNASAARSYFENVDPGYSSRCPSAGEGYEIPLWRFYQPGKGLVTGNGIPW